MLIPTILRVAFGVMGQPVLICIHSDQVLKTYRDTGFLVRFEFGQAEYYISLDDRSRDHVFVVPARVVAIDLAGIVIRSVVMAGAVMTNEFTCVLEIKDGCSIGISLEPSSL